MAKKKGIDLTIIVDVIHVIEYLWDAGRAFQPDNGVDLETWVRDRLLEILRGKAGFVAGGMRRSATLRGLTPEKRKPVDACADYLLNHVFYLKYNLYLAQGFPIATGVIKEVYYDKSGEFWKGLLLLESFKVAPSGKSNLFYLDFLMGIDEKKQHTTCQVLVDSASGFNNVIHCPESVVGPEDFTVEAAQQLTK